MKNSRVFIVVIVNLLAATLACTALTGGGKAGDGEMSVVINSPTDNSQVAVGQEVSVQLTINDPQGVVNRQELRVNGVVVATSEAVAPEGSSAFAIRLPYTPTQAGTFAVSAIVYGSDQSQSEPATMTLVVTGDTADAGLATATATTTSSGGTAPPTNTPNPTPVPDARGCNNDMDYVADVTIPDGTVLDPGQAFTKTWTIRNSGTCDWGGYTLVFASDNQMSGPPSITVPATSSGLTVNVSVNLVAPTDSGKHFSRWTMRSADGDLFGDKIYAEIVVQGDQPDLVIDNFTTSPGEPIAGQVTTYNVKIKNQGTEDAEASTLRGVFETAGSATVPVPAIDAGDTTTVQLTATTPAKGQWDVTLIVDNGDDVDEGNETNNELTANVTYVTIASSGTINADEHSGIDLDTGAAAGGDCNGSSHDLDWEGDSPSNRILEPCNGATILLMGANKVGLDECAAANLKSASVNIDGKTGQWVCALTSEGVYSAFKIDDLGSATDPLVLSYTTYE